MCAGLVVESVEMKSSLCRASSSSMVSCYELELNTLAPCKANTLKTNVMFCPRGTFGEALLYMVCGWRRQLSLVERDPHLIVCLFIESHAMKMELDSIMSY